MCDRIQASDFTNNTSFIKPWAFEKNFDTFEWVQWHSQNATIITVISLLVVLVYLSLAFIGQRVMENQKPFQLRALWTFWNFTLAVFSLLGFLRTSPEFFYTMGQDNGLHLTLCRPVGLIQQTTAVWAILFTVSKFIELGDTAFIVLTKKPLTFLNWGHHSATLLIVVQGYLSCSAPGVWYMVMNYFVHAPMYTYFGLKTLNVETPKVCAVMITTIQLVQMVIGLFVSGYSAYAKVTDIPCNSPTWHSVTMLFIYVVLTYSFTKLFYVSYIKEKPGKKSRKSE